MENLLLITFWFSLFAIAIFIITAVVQFLKRDSIKGKRHLKWMGISIAVMVISFIGLGFIEGSKETETVEEEMMTTTEERVLAEAKTKESAVVKEDSADKKAEKEEELYYLNEEAVLNDVAYTVDSINTSDTVAGYTSQSGTYLIVTLTVRNNGNEGISLNNGDFTVLIDGAEYEDDATTSAYYDGGFLLEKLNPKMSKTASVVYEVPSNAFETLKTLQIQPNRFKEDKLVIRLEKRP